jgi:hypothetical protein
MGDGDESAVGETGSTPIGSECPGGVTHRREAYRDRVDNELGEESARTFPIDEGVRVWGRLGFGLVIASSLLPGPAWSSTTAAGCMASLRFLAEWWLGCWVRARSGRGVGHPREDRHAAPCES